MHEKNVCSARFCRAQKKNTMNCPAAKYKQLPIDPKIHIHYYWPESPFNTEQSIIRGLSVHFERTHLHPKKPFGQTKHAVIFFFFLFVSLFGSEHFSKCLSKFTNINYVCCLGCSYVRSQL